MIWPFKRRTEKKTLKRGYNAALMNRLTTDWTASSKSANSEIVPSLKVLRARSRDLCINNDYAKRFLNLLRVNVCGPNGVMLQNKSINSDGKPDKDANNKVESAFKEWSKKGTCTLCGQYSFPELQKAVVEAVAKDGEVLIRKVKKRNLEHGFALQVIEADYLDEDYNDQRNGITGGVQRDKHGRPTAYFLWTSHPGDDAGTVANQKKVRIPAREIIHVFKRERPGQGRGVPWLSVSAHRMKQLNAIEESELVASRIAASKMGFFTSDGEYYDGEEGDDGSVITEAEPGIFEQLPPGMKLETFDPNHPNTAFAAFVKSILRGIASGLNVSYVSLANDLEGVSYSSIRQGELADRDNWRDLQQWLIENFVDDVFSEWFDAAMLKGAISNLPLAKASKFKKPTWKTNGWSWVDPQKEVQSNIWAVQNGFKSLTNVLSEQGLDVDEVLSNIAAEKELAETYGLKLPTLTGEQYDIEKENAIGPIGAAPENKPE